MPGCRGVLGALLFATTLGRLASAQPVPEIVVGDEDEHPSGGQLVALAMPPVQPVGLGGWRRELGGGGHLATPAVHEGRVYLGGGFSSRHFYALRAETGEPDWVFEATDAGPSAAAVAEGVVVYHTESCTVYVHDAETGQLLWSRWLGTQLLSQPTLGPGVVLAAYPEGRQFYLGAFGLRTGDLKWRQQLPSEVLSAPVLASGVVAAATVDGSVSAFALDDGRPRFRTMAGATSAPRGAGGRLWFAQRSPAAAPGRPLAGVPQEGWNALDPATGSLRARWPLAARGAPHLVSARYARASIADLLRARRAWEVLAEEIATRLETSPEASPDGARLGRGLRHLVLAGGSPVAGRVADLLGPAEHLLRSLEGLPGALRARGRAPDLAGYLDEAVPNLRYLLAQGEEPEAPDPGLLARAGQGPLQETLDPEAAALTPQVSGLETYPGFLDQAEVRLGVEGFREIWEYQGSRPVLAAGWLVSVQGGALRALDPASGALVYERELIAPGSRARPLTPPALAGGRLYLGTADGRLLILDPRDGATLETVLVGGTLVAEPAVHRGSVYLTTVEGHLMRVDTGDPGADGWPMWGGGPGRGDG